MLPRLLATGAALLCAATASVVDVSLRAKWPSGSASFAAETSEFVSDEDPSGNSFWRYIGSVLDANQEGGSVPHDGSGLFVGDSITLAARAVALAQPLLPTLTFEVLRLALAARAYSPAVEYQRQLSTGSLGFGACARARAESASRSSLKGAAPGAGWADVVVELPAGEHGSRNGSVLIIPVCSPSALEAAVAAASLASSGVSREREEEVLDGLQGAIRTGGGDPRTVAYESEHWYPAATPAAQLLAESAPLVQLHLSLDSPGAEQWHRAVRTLAANGTVRALLRIWLRASNPILPDFDDADQDPVLPSSAASSPFLSDGTPLPGSITWLSGYGVGFDVKSTEYKVLDDRSVAAAEAEAKLAQEEASASQPASADLLELARLDGTLAHILGLGTSGGSSSTPSASSSGTGEGGAGNACVNTRVGGLDWGKLEGLRPDKVKQLGKAKARLAKLLNASSTSSAARETPCPTPTDPLLALWDGRLQPFEVGDLGLQAAAVVLDAAARAESGESGPGADPLATLVTVSSNFPSLARALSRVPVPESLRSEVAANARFVQPGQSVMTINGIQVDPTAPTFNLFSLLNVLRAEARVAAQLDTLPLAPRDRRRVQALAIKKTGEGGGGGEEGEGGAGKPSPASGPVRIDIIIDPTDVFFSGQGTGVSVSGEEGDGTALAAYGAAGHNHSIVSWLTDVEKDEEFAQFPSDMRALMQQSWNLHQIRRNLYTTLAFVDVATAQGMKVLTTLFQFSSMRVPIKFGLVLMPGGSVEEAEALSGAYGPTAAPSSSARLTGLQAAQMVADLTLRFGNPGAKAFLQAVAHASMQKQEHADAVANAANKAEEERNAKVHGKGKGKGAKPGQAQAQGALGDGTAVGAGEDAGLLTVGEAMGVYAEVSQTITGSWTKGGHMEAGRGALVDASGVVRAAVRNAVRWARTRGLTAPALVVNGRVSPAGGAGNNFQNELMTLVGADMQLLQGAVFSSKLDDNVSPSVLHALLGRATRLSAVHAREAKKKASMSASLPAAQAAPVVYYALPGAGTVMPVWHPSVLAADEEQVFLPLSAPQAAPMLAAIPFVSAPGTVDDVKPVSLTLFDDLDSPEGLFSLASMLAYVRTGPGDTAASSTACVGDIGFVPGACPAPVAHLHADIARALRVGVLHVPELRLGAGSGHASIDSANMRVHGVGELLSVLLSLTTGAAPSVLYIKADDQGRIAAGFVNCARSAVRTAGLTAVAGDIPTDTPLEVFTNFVTEWLSGVGKEAPVKPRVAEKLLHVLMVATRGLPMQPLSSGDEGSDLVDAIRFLLLAQRNAADIARRLLPDALPDTRSTTASGASGNVSEPKASSSLQMRLRGVAANGRILSLLPMKRNMATSQAQSCEGGVYPAPHPETDGKAVLAACLTPEDVAVLSLHERLQRGAAVAALLQTCDFGAAGVDADTLTADWMSSVAQSAASAVGASLTVRGGASAGGRASSRVALRTDFLGAKVSAFTTTRRGSVGEADGVAGGTEEKKREEGGATGLHVTAIIDPASEDAQRYAPLLLMLRDRLGATVRLHLNPGRGFSDIPVKSFFRYVLPVEIPVHSVGTHMGAAAAAGLVSHPRAVFAWLPPSSILTLKVYSPEPWNTQLAAAAMDTDNMKLDRDGPAPAASHSLSSPSLHRGTARVSVAYELKDLLAAGTCLDGTGGAVGFPNGLQLTLGPKLHTQESGSGEGIVSDTLVMQNLGYWQLKAQPGVWTVRLARGRADDLYSIIVPTAAGASAGGRASFSSSDVAAGHAFLRRVADPLHSADATPVYSLDVAVRDFTGQMSLLMVRKRAGKERESLLSQIGSKVEEEEEKEGKEDKGLLGSIGRSLFGSGAVTGDGGKGLGSNGALVVEKELVHVFSLASGWLYERFLKIMMLAAVKASPTVRLKFWLVENFLSPAFKAFAPVLAGQYGAEVGFVTYKWPNWLRGQSEKQRIIWGYKILFLDVLFPLHVTKVIYIDADQVVRSDLSELAHHDLEGAPYAFTPFCTSRKDTLGYQFWRDGFWKDHLRGRPYHISALYVIDLVAFRRAAVGDNLRAIYDQLSRDPNSLANLDQDLPNYAQHIIPIHSLPQEWLWCESWCSEDSKNASKTIDLCNNPRYKEPKLNMARRVISGALFPQAWDELDAEIASVEGKWAAARAQAKAALPQVQIRVEEASIGADGQPARV